MTESAGALMEKIDAVAQAASAEIERALADALAAIHGALARMREETIPLAKSLERRSILERLQLMDLPGGGRATDGAEALSSPVRPHDAPTTGDAVAPPGPRPSSRITVLQALVDAGGSLPKSDVRERVLRVGLSEGAYKKMRGRLKAAGLIVDADDKLAWTITDLGRREAGRLETEIPAPGPGDTDETKGGAAVTDET